MTRSEGGKSGEREACGRPCARRAGKTDRLEYTRDTSVRLPRNRRLPRSLGHVRRILNHGANGVLVVVETQIAVHGGRMKPAQHFGTIPVGKVIRICLRVL